MKEIFEANVRRVHFTQRSSLYQVVIPLVKPLDLKTSNATFQLKWFKSNDRLVFVNEGITVVIKYIGYLSFAEEKVVDIELDDLSANAHHSSANSDIIFSTLWIPGAHDSMYNKYRHFQIFFVFVVLYLFEPKICIPIESESIVAIQLISEVEPEQQMTATAKGNKANTVLDSE
ncbi:hypothetical protein RFI_22825 [Reticulomyxa filosa]|uniref:Uncharacterized protein n=1 Tax=Reticulomyxa filosa TaxID=46433 RepID=X6MKK1_RETFI|nr:hypothetical protein RFI_22825 [Reticulomyxa filosa]|eukprot:ETO14543.1 hypothetical protein RFI_22825 [Reticulomyxa filosa]